MEEQDDVQEAKKKTISTTITAIATAPLCAPAKFTIARAALPKSPADSLAAAALRLASRAAFWYCFLIRRFCCRRERVERASSGFSCKVF